MCKHICWTDCDINKDACVHACILPNSTHSKPDIRISISMNIHNIIQIVCLLFTTTLIWLKISIGNNIWKTTGCVVNWCVCNACLNYASKGEKSIEMSSEWHKINNTKCYSCFNSIYLHFFFLETQKKEHWSNRDCVSPFCSRNDEYISSTWYCSP